MPDLDQRVRLAAFDWLDRPRQLHGEVLRRDLLIEGFTFEGRRVPLISPQQGIHKPAVLDLPLSILTSPPSERKLRRYDDSLSPDGLLLYRYRGTDAAHRDNVGLRDAMRCGCLWSTSTASCPVATWRPGRSSSSGMTPQH
jgi:putative restriction endonuclease